MRAVRNSGAFRGVGPFRISGGTREVPNGGFRPEGSFSPEGERAGYNRGNAAPAPGGRHSSGDRGPGWGPYGQDPSYGRPDGSQTTVIPDRPRGGRHGAPQRPAGYEQPGRGGRRAAPPRGPGRRGRPGGPGGPGGPNGPGGPRGPRDPRAKVKGSWWRVWTIRKALGVLAALIGGFFLLVFLTVLYVYHQTPIPTQELEANTFQNSTVYYSDGHTVMGTFGQYNRQLLTYNQIPKVVQDAVLAAEERSYWTDGAVSPTGMLRAAYDDVFNGGGSLSGGSTITQEFVRQFYDGIGTQQTMSRKIKEIFVAMKVSKSKSKQWILTNYLNVIYLGDGAYGVGAAAQTYFGEPVSKLTVAQAAVIAAIIQQPTNYPLPQYRSNLIARWHYVLNGMVKMGDLSAQQAATLKFPDMRTGGDLQSGSDPWDAYVLQQVKDELEAYYGFTDQQVDDDGLKIVTTLSYKDTKELYNAVNDNVKLMKEDGGALPYYALIGAELQDPTTGAILAEYPGRGQNMPTAQCQKYDCDNNTILSREQVGSSFKPYVLAEAVREGMDVQTSTLNGYSPLYVPPDSDASTLSSTNKNSAQSNWYKVNNDGDETLGAMNVQNAFAQSSNTAFTDLIHRVGTQNVVNFAQTLGVNIAASPNGSNLQNTVGEVGMALGIDSLSVNEQSQMLSALANNGTYHQAHVIASVTSFGNTTPAKYTTRTVLTEAQASQVQYAMETVTSSNGTAAAAAMTDGRQIIAKTGTTTNYHSAFFLGAIPQAALTVGIFTEGQNANSSQNLANLGGSNGQTGFGGYWPARIWHEFMESVYGNSQIENFPSPQFSGSAWDQVAKTKANGKKKTQNNNGNGNKRGRGNGNNGNPVSEPTSTATASPTAGATASASPTCTPGVGSTCIGTGLTTGASVSSEQAGAVVGGILAVLPGSLLWNNLARRRKRRRKP